MRFITDPRAVIKDWKGREVRRSYGCLVLTLTSYDYIVLMGTLTKEDAAQSELLQQQGWSYTVLQTGGGLQRIDGDEVTPHCYHRSGI